MADTNMERSGIYMHYTRDREGLSTSLVKIEKPQRCTRLYIDNPMIAAASLLQTLIPAGDLRPRMMAIDIFIKLLVPLARFICPRNRIFVEQQINFPDREPDKSLWRASRPGYSRCSP